MLIRALLLLILLLPTRAWAGLPVQWQLCDDHPPANCRAAVPEQLTLAEPIVTLIGTVEIPEGESGSLPALAIDLDAMASAGIRWNGTPIGGNGIVGPDDSEEVPGRYSASIPVPAALLRPGLNDVVIRLSSHHLWLPVSQPIHRIEVGAPVDADAYTLRHYVPALATLAMPAMALAMLAMLFHSGRTGRSAILPGAILGIILLQGALETSKLAFNYSYPWHLARMVALTGFTAIVSFLLVVLAARMFAPAALRTAGLLAATGMGIVIFVVAGLDQKALALFQTGLAGVALLAIGPALRRERQAAVVLVAALAVLAWSHLAGPAFLDRGYYNVAAIASLLLCLAAARRHNIAEAGTAPVSSAETPMIIHDGSRQHVVVASEITRLNASDDYCSIYFADGREIMVTMPLKTLLALLPAEFVRIHRSHAVNLTRVTSVRPGPKGSRTVVLQDGVILPVGRTFVSGLRDALGNSSLETV